jgi:hypothetical protein
MPDSASNVDTEGTTAENEQNPDANLVGTPTATQTTTAVPELLQDDQSTIYTAIEPASSALKGSGPSSPTSQMTDQSWPEQPRQFLERIKETLSKAELANLLSKGCDPFHMAVLRIHMDSFDFRRDPIDLALRYGKNNPAHASLCHLYKTGCRKAYVHPSRFILNSPKVLSLWPCRKFLLDFHFPKEAQQIDRVLEAFASRYHVCNPQLFRSGGKERIVCACALTSLRIDQLQDNTGFNSTQTIISLTVLIHVPFFHSRNALCQMSSTLLRSR